MAANDGAAPTGLVTAAQMATAIDGAIALSEGRIRDHMIGELALVTQSQLAAAVNTAMVEGREETQRISSDGQRLVTRLTELLQAADESMKKMQAMMTDSDTKSGAIGDK